MIKVLIVEDSPVMQELLAYTIESDPAFSIVGIAADGEEAIEYAAKKKPDVIAMDCYMPKLDGQKATRKIMETTPVPIVIVTSSITANDVAISFSLIEAGALAIVKKPTGIGHPDYKKEARELLRTLKLMSEVKVVRRVNHTKKTISNIQPVIDNTTVKEQVIKLIAIGASTGGPMILQKILTGLPKNVSVPILIVQHISPGFTEGFVKWLGNTTQQRIHIASDGEHILPGHIYFAPDNYHMGVDRQFKIILSNDPPINGLRPSVAFLFRTVANLFGLSAIGILLTGMGRDGAEELKLMREKGSITIAQNKASAVVFGMPGEAVKLGAATHVLSPEGIISVLTSLINKKNGG